MILAYISEVDYRVLADYEDVPQGAIVFRSPEEMASLLSVQSMDTVRKRILGQFAENSPSRQEAARRLWHLLTISVAKPFAWNGKTYNKKKDGFGNNKIRNVMPIELLQLTWEPGKDGLIDIFHRKLPPQAKKIVEILKDDGRRIWTNEEANAVVAARANEIVTRQGSQRIFTYYKSVLCLRKILRRVSFDEFRSNPEFRGLTLTNLNQDILQKEA